MTKTWTEERETLLIDMWGRGISITQIAELMDLSRSTIGGKLHRLGLMGDIRACNERYFRTKGEKIAQDSAYWDCKLFEPYAVRKARMERERFRA